MDVLAHRRNFPRSKSGVIGLFSPAIHKVLRLGNIFTFILILVFIFPALAICGVASNQDAVGKGKSYYFDSQYDKAIELLLPVANNANNPEAQYYVGLIYSISAWEKSSIDDSIRYLLSSADQNYAPAMWKIGDLHDSGLLGEKNSVIATDWYRKSKRAEQNASKLIFYKEDDTAKLVQTQRASLVTVIKKKAMSGDIESQFRMGKIYNDGVLVPQNIY